MSFAELTRTRYSCRKYEDRAVEPEKLAAILEAGRISPSACNKHPSRVVVCDTPELLKRATSAAPHFDRGGSIFGAPLVLVVCAKMGEAWVREYDDMDSSDIDTSIVVDQMMMQAEDLGLATCWVCHFDPNAAIDALGLPDGLYPIHMLVVGYAADEIAAPEKRAARCIPMSEFRVPVLAAAVE